MKLHAINIMKYDFGFRVDTGIGIGSGHFYRCISIADELISLGKKIVFLVKNENEILMHFGNRKIPHIVLNSNSIEDEITECKKYLLDIRILIIDLPFQNESYSRLLSTEPNIVIIDDQGNKEICSRMLFNGSIVKEYQKYTSKNTTTEFYLGPEFMILRKEFVAMREKINLSNKPIKKILLMFGGTDNEDLAKKILPFFVKTNYEVEVVLGLSHPHITEIKKLSQKYDNVNVNVAVQDIASLFSKQDLVISSAGITSYELACLGIPSILIPTSPHENPTASELMVRGFGINYGYWDNDFSKLEDKISRLDDHKVREMMFLSGRKIVDGNGLFRVIKKLLSLERQFT